jgi:hypothetical protein
MVLGRSLATVRAAVSDRRQPRTRRSERDQSPAGEPADTSRRPGQLASLVTVATLLLLTTGIRAAGLPGGGPVAYDEGWAASTGRFLVSLLTHPSVWSQLRHGHLHVFVFGHDWKLGHDLLLGMLMAGGASPENLSWLSALAGVAMIVALAALAGRRWGAPAGAIAGVFAGTLPLTIVYGHRITAEADGLAGVALALLLWDRWWDRRPSRPLVLATLAVFLATMSLSYRLVPVLLPLGLVLAWLGWWFRSHDLPPRVPTGRLIGVCVAVPLAMVAAVYLLVVARAMLGVPRLPAELQNQFIRSSAGVPVPFAFPEFYPRTFWDFAGPVFILAVAVGLAVFARSWKTLDPLASVAIGSLLGSFFLFSAVHDKAPRAIVVCVIFAALVVARGLPLLELRALRWPVALALCGALLVSGWVGSAVARDPSGTGRAGRWLAAHPGSIVTTRGPVFLPYTERTWSVVTGPDPAYQIITPGADTTIASLRQAGARWVVVDAHALLQRSPVFAQLLECGRPAVEFDDRAGWSRVQFLEEADSLHLGYGPTLALRAQALAAAQGAQTLRIYDLEGAGTAACR